MSCSAAMIAFNFYEPLASARFDRHRLGFSDTLCMLGLFLRQRPAAATDDRNHRSGHGAVSRRRSIMPAGSSSAWRGALVTMAIVILAFHAAPVHKKIFTRDRLHSPSPRSGWGWTISGWGSSSMRPAPSSRGTVSASRDPYHQYGQGGPVQVLRSSRGLADPSPGSPALRRGVDPGEEAGERGRGGRGRSAGRRRRHRVPRAREGEGAVLPPQLSIRPQCHG